MFKVILFFILISSTIVQSEEIAARITVNSYEDVIVLHEKGFKFEDVKIHERIGFDGKKQYQAVYCSENGFVTVWTNNNGLLNLKKDGFEITEIQSQNPANFQLNKNMSSDTISYQLGWPRMIFNGNSLYQNSPTVADINKDGLLNVSVTNAWGSYPNNPPYLIVWKHIGTYLSGFPTALQPGSMQSSADDGISAAGDIFGDNKLEFVLGDENGFLYAFNYNGTSLAGFPVNYGSSNGVFTPALADFDKDGKLDIAFITHNWSNYTDAYLHLVKVTETGPQEFPGFPINIELGYRNSPAVGDLDGDGELEIVVGTGGKSDSSILAKIIAFDKSGIIKRGFPWIVGKNSVSNTPSLYDINGDKKLEIFIRVKPDYNQINGIYAIDHLGNLLPGYPFPTRYGTSTACVAIGDMTGDGIPEIAYGGTYAVDQGEVYAFDLAGNLLTGFPAPVLRTWVEGGVAIADVDGDSLGDIVCGTNGVSNKPGLIWAFNYEGQPISGFPLSPGNPVLNSFYAHPTLVDIDRDGDTEIFAGRLDKYVYGWDTKGVYDSSKVWSTFKGNAQRTGGQLKSPSLVSVNPTIELPEQFVLEQNYPNPFNPVTSIRYELPINLKVTLKVFNVLGQEIITLVDEDKKAGKYEITFDASNLSSGLYYYRLQAVNNLSNSTENFVQTKKLILVK